MSEPKSEVSRKVSGARGEQSVAEELKSQRDREHTISGDYSLRVPPVPIPNTEVKPQHADGTWLETARESRSSPDSMKFIVIDITMICLSSSMAEHSAVNRRVTGSSPVGGATSERVTLVPIFYCIKNPSPAPLFLLVSQKVTLRLCCSLVNALTTLRLATNFLRYRMVSPFSILYGEEAAAVCFNSALLSVLLSEKGRHAAGSRGSAASRQAKRRRFRAKPENLHATLPLLFPVKRLLYGASGTAR